jgi:hypothetical protein
MVKIPIALMLAGFCAAVLAVLFAVIFWFVWPVPYPNPVLVSACQNFLDFSMTSTQVCKANSQAKGMGAEIGCVSGCLVGTIMGLIVSLLVAIAAKKKIRQACQIKRHDHRQQQHPDERSRRHHDRCPGPRGSQGRVFCAPGLTSYCVG